MGTADGTDRHPAITFSSTAVAGTQESFRVTLEFHVDFGPEAEKA